MPEIQAFRGIRYDLGHVGALSDVVAPPYDVIDAELQSRLYEKHPANVVRLILNREEPGDDEHENRYSRAARLLRDWLREGVLQTDSVAAVYVYHQVFRHEGAEYVRRGFMARVRLQRFGEGNIYPHEQTIPGPKADRLKLMTACRANLSQIFGLYPDAENAAQSLLDAAIAGQTPLEAVDHLGVVHRMWMVTDVKTIGELTALMAPKPVFVADGHHRYETACNYRDALAAEGPLDPGHPANFVLMMFVGMSDPGMIVLPTHRLFRGLPPMTAEDLARRLEGCFATTTLGRGAAMAQEVWEEIETGDAQDALGLYTAADDRWTLARIRDEGRQRLRTLAPEMSDEWRSLGVSILHRLVIDDLLAAPDLPKPKYVHAVSEVIDGLVQGDQIGRDATGQEGRGGRFELAALVMPASVEHVRRISELGERMPAKSTYFYPKLLSGLVFHPLW